jgi:hypothetical protein
MCVQEAVLDDCLTDCAKLMQSCAPQIGAVTRCLDAGNASFSCSADGQPQLVGCDADAPAYNQCVACIVVPSDDSCASCVKTQCCQELQAVLASTDVEALNTCIMGCGAALDCITACNAAHPDLNTAQAQLDACKANCACP